MSHGNNNSYRSPLSRARGLGSAKEGVSHWWMQRLTAIALVPLILWCIFALASLGSADYESIMAWIGHPLVAILLVILCIAMFYHSSLGIQVVVEDYVHTEWLKLTTLVLVNFVNFLLAVISIFFILKIAFGN